MTESRSEKLPTATMMLNQHLLPDRLLSEQRRFVGKFSTLHLSVQTKTQNNGEEFMKFEVPKLRLLCRRCDPRCRQLFHYFGSCCLYSKYMVRDEGRLRRPRRLV